MAARASCTLSPPFLKLDKAQRELAGLRRGSLDRWREQEDPVGGPLLAEAGQAPDVGLCVVFQDADDGRTYLRRRTTWISARPTRPHACMLRVGRALHIITVQYTDNRKSS